MTRLAPLVFVLCMYAPAVRASEPAWITETLAALDAHLDRHPAAEADDLYKLIHQAVAGPGHAIDDPAAARRWLEREIAGLAPSAHHDPLCERIGGDPTMVRVHLRPFVAGGFDPGDLADAFMQTGATVRTDPVRLESALAAAIGHVRDTRSVDLADALEALRADLSARGFPAVHHSRTFRESYAPAYRIVTKGLADTARWCDDLATIDDTGPSDADTGADVDAGPRAGS
jgi:hypothetical protein